MRRWRNRELREAACFIRGYFLGREHGATEVAAEALNGLVPPSVRARVTRAALIAQGVPMEIAYAAVDYELLGRQPRPPLIVPDEAGVGA